MPRIFFVHSARLSQLYRGQLDSLLRLTQCEVSSVIHAEPLSHWLGVLRLQVTIEDNIPFIYVLIFIEFVIPAVLQFA